MQIIEITKEPVELYKVLKFEGLAESGGDAKALIAEGLVSVNGEVEMRKRCKLREDDIILIGEQEFKLVMAEQ